MDIDTIKDFRKVEKYLKKFMKKETVSVIGLGFVGFPMACILASKKDFFDVIGIDKDIEKIKKEKIEAQKKCKFI